MTPDEQVDAANAALEALVGTSAYRDFVDQYGQSNLDAYFAADPIAYANWVADEMHFTVERERTDLALEALFIVGIPALLGATIGAQPQWRATKLWTGRQPGNPSGGKDPMPDEGYPQQEAPLSGAGTPAGGPSTGDLTAALEASLAAVRRDRGIATPQPRPLELQPTRKERAARRVNVKMLVAILIAALAFLVATPNLEYVARGTVTAHMEVSLVIGLVVGVAVYLALLGIEALAGRLRKKA
jgi:hypothetical protein